MAIVVAENDRDILMVVQRLLARAGHDVVPTAGGAELSGHLIPGDTAAVEHATAVLRKPFLAQELITCVDKVLQAGHVEGQGPVVCP